MFAEIDKKIISILSSCNDGITEHELMQDLTDELEKLAGNDEGSLGLFKKHFLLMHCLYRLQTEYWQQANTLLTISPLKIKLEKLGSGDGAELSEPIDTNLRDYYLDWSNFELTGENEVNDLLDSFWQDYAKYIQRDEAWEILGLPAGSDKSTITIRYRELAAVHHPDKGGDKDTFIKIRAAYEHLK